MDDATRDGTAREPEQLSDLFLARANAGDVEGVVALYEPNAVLALPDGGAAIGHAAIRAFYGALLAGRPRLESAGQRTPLRADDLALTCTLLPGGNATTEVARRQPDGSWRWIIDQPRVLPE
jgi:ketosteroid isomerase-like protein